MNKKVRVNHDYFALSGRWDNLRYFLSQGHVAEHIIDRVKWHYCPKYFIAPNFPCHLDIEASSLCQMRCPMCKTTEMMRQGMQFGGVMEFELFKKIIDECALHGVYSIKLSWRGEPLLNPDIVRMVAYAKKKKIKDVAFLSNGERLGGDLSRDLILAGLDWISVSFDGLKEVYDKIRAPAVFEGTIAKVKELRALRKELNRSKPLIRIQTVRSAIEGREEEFLELWKGVADRVNFIADQKRSLSCSDYRHDPSYICPSPWQRMCVSWDGLVAQCYGDYILGNVMGDVKSQTLAQIWRSDNFSRLRALMKDGQRLSTKPCRTCSDGGVTEPVDVLVGRRKVRAERYVEQGIDVKKLTSE